MKLRFSASTHRTLHITGFAFGVTILTGLTGITSTIHPSPVSSQTSITVQRPTPSPEVPIDPSLLPPVIVPTFPTAAPWKDIKLLHTLKNAHWGPVHSLTFSRDGKLLASGGGEIDNRVRLWDPKTGKRKRSIRAHSIRVLGLAITPDNRTLATGSDDTSINLWNLKNGSLSRRFVDPVTNVMSLAITPDGQTLVSGGLEGIRLWDLKAQRLLYTMVPIAQPVIYSVAISPSQPLLASGGKDGVVQLWNLNGGQLISTVGRHAGAVSSVAFTPDGDSVVSGSYDHSVKVWNFATGTAGTFLGHTNVVYAVAVNPDGQTLASGGRDGVKLWDLRTQQQLGSVPGYTDWVQSLAFSPDGKLLATGGFDGTIRIWQGVY